MDGVLPRRLFVMKIVLVAEVYLSVPCGVGLSSPAAPSHSFMR